MAKPELVVAPLTPFTSGLKVDEASLKREIDYVVEDCAATMVVAAGVEAQEYTYLGLEERKALIQRTVEYVAGRCPVMVGISHPSFKTAIDLAHYAKNLGAHAVQMLAPLRPFGGPSLPKKGNFPFCKGSFGRIFEPLLKTDHPEYSIEGGKEVRIDKKIISIIYIEKAHWA